METITSIIVISITLAAIAYVVWQSGSPNYQRTAEEKVALRAYYLEFIKSLLLIAALTVSVAYAHLLITY